VAGPNDPYQGALKGWRPGWAAARTLTSPNGYLCHGNPSASVAHCLDNVQQKGKNYELDLLAGSLAGASTGPLQKVAHIGTLGSRGQLMWGASLLPGRRLVPVLVTRRGEDTEVLRMAPATDGGVGPPARIRARRQPLAGGARQQEALLPGRLQLRRQPRPPAP
jgi:hypothetical protein